MAPQHHAITSHSLTPGFAGSNRATNQSSTETAVACCSPRSFSERTAGKENQKRWLIGLALKDLQAKPTGDIDTTDILVPLRRAETPTGKLSR
jgi:hypothetical protein